jgi:glucokinase
MANSSILVADIGGTSSRFAHFSLASGELRRLGSLWLKTGDYQSFDAVLSELDTRGFVPDFSAIDIFVIAGAGPVEDRCRIKLTNAPWGIDVEALSDNHQAKQTIIINDFVAQAYSAVSPIEIDCVIKGEVKLREPKAIIGAGTGLGQGAIVYDLLNRPLAIPSEGGHVHYAAESEEEFRFLDFLKQLLKIPYPSWEDALSGDGLERTHLFLTGVQLDASEIGAGLDSANLGTARCFARNLGRVCRNLALQYLAGGGVYIAGGIVAKNRILVELPEFRESFFATRMHAGFLSEVSVFVIDNQESGLWGAAQLGRIMLEGR